MIYNRVIEIEHIDANEVWRPYCTARAYVNGLFGSEYWAARQANAENTVTFEVRYCRGVAAINPAEYRIVFDGKVYDIQNVDNPQFSNRIIKIKAVESVGRH